jgi:hypothetical protein
MNLPMSRELWRKHAGLAQLVQASSVTLDSGMGEGAGLDVIVMNDWSYRRKTNFEYCRERGRRLGALYNKQGLFGTMLGRDL